MTPQNKNPRLCCFVFVHNKHRLIFGQRETGSLRRTVLAESTLTGAGDAAAGIQAGSRPVAPRTWAPGFVFLLSAVTVYQTGCILITLE